MCGIFGILAPSPVVSEGLLRRALCTLEHRGPDDSGTVIIPDCSSRDHQLGLAHTRLSIIDLSPLGHQPMQDPATRNWIVYNGEIYNYKQLRKELEDAGVKFSSHSDTEVILAAYRFWGESCLTRLDGMFAFALWDALQEKLILARDPMGIKPLYYHQSERGFIFGSETRTLLGTGLVPKKVDPTGLLSFLEFGSVSEPWTIVEGVRTVPPGHMLTVKKGSVSSREYWNPLRFFHGALEAPSRNGRPAEEKLPVILRDAVLSHLISDVPVGVFLSGGIDSSALVAVLSNNGVRANTFSLVFRDEEYNEAQFSREVARRFHTEHHEIAVSEHDTLALLPDALRAMDQPTIDGINTYVVSAHTRAAGVKVALSGLGADEMFAGYSNFRRVPRMERFMRRFGRLPRFAHKPLAASFALLAGKSDRNRKLVEMTGSENAAVHPYFLVRALFGSSDCETLISPADYQLARQSLERMEEHAITESNSLDPVNRVAYLESTFYMRNTLLRDSDFMSMAHGLELRVPFLDRALVEACFRIPGARKLEGPLPKGLLLASLGVELLPEIVNRPKRGFTLPFERWLRGEMRPVVEDSLLNGNWGQTTVKPDAARRVWNRFLSGETSWSRPWSLFVLQRWCANNF
jgi:asparagine synthase (glutamine-hydrolysing)